MSRFKDYCAFVGLSWGFLWLVGLFVFVGVGDLVFFFK